MIDESLHPRRPLPPQPLLPREEMLRLINELTVDMVIYGGRLPDARQVESTITPTPAMVITGISSLVSQLGGGLEAVDTLTNILMKFRNSLLSDYNLNLDGDSGRIVVGNLDYVDVRDHASTVT